MYWYRPKEVREEKTGLFLRWEKRFSGEKLHRSYNQYAKMFGVSARQITPSLDNLVTQGFIFKELKNITLPDGKQLYNVMYLSPNVEKIKFATYGDDYSNEIQNTFDLEGEKPKPKKDFSENTKKVQRVIDYLNEKTGKNYKAKSYVKIIIARFNDGFTEKDFFKVIDNKVSDWGNNEKMAPYLRPQTLFGNKFDSYLNQNINQKEEPKSETKSKMARMIDG